MFRDHKRFEAFIRCYWACSVDSIDEQYEGTFDADDLAWLVGAGKDDFQQFASQVLSIVEANGVVISEENIKKVQALSQQCLSRRVRLYSDNKWGRYLRNYNDDLQTAPGKHVRDRGAKYFAIGCGACGYWMYNYASKCQICDTKRRQPCIAAE